MAERITRKKVFATFVALVFAGVAFKACSESMAETNTVDPNQGLGPDASGSGNETFQGDIPDSVTDSVTIPTPTGRQVLTASDGTPFNIVPDPLDLGRLCAEISGKFKNENGHRQDAGRLAEALFGGSVTIYFDPPASEPSFTFDADKDLFHPEAHWVDPGDIGCSNEIFTTE